MKWLNADHQLARLSGAGGVARPRPYEMHPEGRRWLLEQQLPYVRAADWSRHAPSLDHFIRLCAWHLTRLNAHADLWIRFRAEGLQAFLEEGRYRTAFEPGATWHPARGSQADRGWHTEFRREKERLLWGVPPDAPQDRRPIYTYPAEGDAGRLHLTDELKLFGAYAVRLRPSVQDRAQFTGVWSSVSRLGPEGFADVFGADFARRVRVTPRVIPTPCRRPGVEAWPWAWNADPLGVPAYDALRWYAEAQVFGGLSAQDALSVTVPAGKVVPDRLRAALRARRLPLLTYGRGPVPLNTTVGGGGVREVVPGGVPLHARFPALHRHVVRHFALNPDGVHGPHHWDRVGRIGTYLCLASGADPLVIELFSLLHDAGRATDGPDPDHGPRAAQLATKLRGQLFDCTDAQFTALHWAITNHTTSGPVADPTLGACLDGDRLDLMRVGLRPEPTYLSLPWARQASTIDWAVGLSR